ncbi:MAG: serine protease [Kiloniellales bacterium]|nr:serine protease [Kiloniellales bacterium]
MQAQRLHLFLTIGRSDNEADRRGYRYLSNYARVLAVRIAMTDVKDAVMALVALPATRPNLDRLSREIERIGSGTETLLNLPATMLDRQLDRLRTHRFAVALRLAESEIETLAVARESLAAINRAVARAAAYGDGSGDRRLAALKVRADTRRQAIRTALLEDATSALASYDETLDGLRDLLARRASLLAAVGNVEALAALTAFQGASAERVQRIAEASLPEAEATLARMPTSFDGAIDALEWLRAWSTTLRPVAPQQFGAFERLANARVDDIYDGLIAAELDTLRASAEAAQSAKADWRSALRLIAAANVASARFGPTIVRERAEQVIRAEGEQLANRVAIQKLDQFSVELAGFGATWKAHGELTQLAATITEAESRIQSLARYTTATRARQSEILTTLAEMARAEIGKAGSNHDDVETIASMGARHAERFVRVKAGEHATAIRRATRQRVEAVLRAGLEPYKRELQSLDPTRATADALRQQAATFAEDARAFGDFDAYREAALARAEEMIDAVCDQVVAQAGLTPVDEVETVLAASGSFTLRAFACDLEAKGHDVRELASPGSLDVTGGYTLKLVQADKAFVFARLERVEAIPGQMLLVGTALGDAALQEPISVNRWRVYAAQLLDVAVPHDVAADGAGVTGPGFGSGRSMSSKQVFDRLRRSAVLLYFVGRGKNGQLIPKHVGTGFFISPRDIMTNAHVAEAYEGYVGTWYAINETVGVHRVTVVKNARKNTPLNIDAAVMQTVDAESSHHLRFSIDMFRDEWIAIGGYPGAAAEFDQRYDILETALKRGHTPRLDELPTALVDQGRLSNIIVQRETKATDLQYTMETAGGSSGSAVVNACGEVVGLHYSGSLSKVRDDDTVAASKYNMAVSSKDVQIFLQLIGVKSDTASKACGIDG